MADQNPRPWTMIAPREAVAESAGGALWSVTECGFRGTTSALPSEIACLFAPPVAVSAAPVAGNAPAVNVAPVVSLAPVAGTAPAVPARLDLTVAARRVAPAPPRAPRRRALIAPR